MRRLFYILTILPLFTYGQTFTLSDTSFEIGDVMISRQLLFDFDKATFRPESYPHLDSVADFLIKKEGLLIEVSNHTDSRWSDAYSTCLTCKRAKAIVDYLISKSVSSDRLIAKGYNDKKLLISDIEIEKLKTKEEIEIAHQTNRRTEYKILQTDYKVGTIYLGDLFVVKSVMTGQWFRILDQDTIVDNFTFVKDSYDGECKSTKYISTAPIFTLVPQENKTIIRWHDLTGGDFDYIIIEMTRNKMTVQYGEKTLEYFKQ